MANIKFIYFDIGGVFLNWTKALENLSTYIKKPYDKVVDIFNRYDNDANKDLFSLNQSWQYIKADLGTEVEIPNFQEWWLNNFTPILPMHNFVKDVIQRHRVGIITNIQKGSFAIAIRKKLIPDLPYEVVVKSCDLNLIKPNEGVFLYAQRKAGVLPSEILFIDDYPPNIKKAKEIGWNVVLFEENDVLASINRIKRYLSSATSW